MLRKILVLAMLALALVSCFKQSSTEVTLPFYDKAKYEVIYKLRLHQEHLKTLKGDARFDAYRLNFLYRSEQIIHYIENNDVHFYTIKHDYCVMCVKGVSNLIPRDGIYVNEKFLSYFKKSDAFNQAVLCDELSHMAFWAEDADELLEDIPAARLSEYSDWYDLVILFSNNQSQLDKFYLTSKP